MPTHAAGIEHAHIANVGAEDSIELSVRSGRIARRTARLWRSQNYVKLSAVCVCVCNRIAFT